MKRLCLAAVLSVAALSAPGSSTIKGTVTGPGGSPLSYLNVEAYRFNGSWWSWSTAADTDSSGNYALTGLSAGDYQVRFHDWSGRYIPEWYDNALDESAATTLVVGVDATVSNINAQLSTGATISGTVTDSGGNPLGSIRVEAYQDSGGWWNSWSSGYTDGTGAYTVGGLTGGKYRVKFTQWEGDYATEWYSDALIADSAASIPVPPLSTVSNINAALGPAAKITGRITGPGGAPLLQDISVTPYLWNGATWVACDSGYSDSNGIYTVGGLPAGEYLLKYQDWQYAYAPAWYSNVLDQAQAMPIAAAAGTTQRNVNATLVPAGRISGTVTGPNGTTPAVGIEVQGYRWTGSSWDWFQSTQTDDAGHYALTGLSAGQYHLSFDDYNNVYMTEWYNNAPNSGGANAIAVSSGGSVSNVNASMAVGAHIAGTVTATNGVTPLAGISVSAYSQNGAEWDWMGSATTDASGHYDIGGLATGLYRIQFYSAGAYQYQYYNRQWDWDLANPVTVAAITTVSNINASLELAGGIAGTVTGPGGATPLKGILVNLYVPSGTNWTYDQTVTTASDGSYAFFGIGAGTFRLQFQDGDGAYVSEWYNNAAGLNGASNIVVAFDQRVAGINATLAETPQTGVSGTVTDSVSGAPLAGIYVQLLVLMYFGDWYWEVTAETTTDPSGKYKFTGLAPGDYRLGFMDWSGAYTSEYFDNAIDAASGADITVTDGQMTTGRDAALDPIPQTGISGMVTEAGSGIPLAGIQVSAYVYYDDFPYGGWWSNVGYAYTDLAGKYNLTGLYSGAYRLDFYDGTGTHLYECYDNAANLDSATDIFVSYGLMTPGRDAALTRVQASNPPAIVGLVNRSGCEWEIRFTGDEGSICVLQNAYSPTNDWNDFGAPTNCCSGTNVMGCTETAPARFWRIRTVP